MSRSPRRFFGTALLAAAFGAACGGGSPAPAPSPAAGPSTPAPSAEEPDPIPPGIPSTPGEYDNQFDVLHYDVEVGLTTGSQEMAAKATITVRSNGAPEAVFDFTGLAIDGIRVNGEVSGFEYDAGKLTIPLATDPESRIAISYSGTPDNGLLLRDNVHGNPTAFVDNWPNRTRFWLPSVDHPTDKATASFTVHAPSVWQVIANGEQVGEPTPTASGALGSGTDRLTWHWKTDVLHPTYTLVIGAADFHIETIGRAACGAAPASPDADGCVEVSFWVFPEDVAFGREVFGRADQMVDYYTDLFGPFPFEKLANVQSSTMFGGMENSSAIFYSEQAIAQSRLGEGTVAHEIAHQWFGDSATEMDWSHLWLSEGFATYFGHQFFEAADGVDAFRQRMEQSRQSYLGSNVTVEPIVHPEADGTLFDLLNANNYPKGGWVLHMLRGVVGEEAFFEGVRDYYGRFALSNAWTADFRSVMEEASGMDLSWFFDQWIHQPGYPTLESEWRWDAEDESVVVTVRQTQSASWPTFRLPMQIQVTGPDGSQMFEADMTEREQEFRFSTGSEPAGIELDPNGWILKG